MGDSIATNLFMLGFAWQKGLVPVSRESIENYGDTNLIDAVVYKTGADVDGVGLDTALLDAGPIVDEFGRDGSAAAGAADSLGRFPSATGALRNTTNWTFMTPTPGLVNVPEPTGLALLLAGGFALAGRSRVRR